MIHGLSRSPCPCIMARLRTGGGVGGVSLWVGVGGAWRVQVVVGVYLVLEGLHCRHYWPSVGTGSEIDNTTGDILEKVI